MNLAKLKHLAIWPYILQRVCTWYPLRRRLAAIASAARPAYAGIVSNEAIKLSEELRRDGVAMLPGFLDGEAIARIVRHVEGAGLRERFPPYRGPFTLDNVPEHVHVAEYSVDHILRCPDVLAIANHPMLLGAAARYLGCKPTISNLSIWWSLPADGTAQEAENFHRDVDDWRFAKLFVYLSDVDADSGPHCFVRGSHRSWRFVRKRRLSDAEVGGAFPSADMLAIQGKRGDAFLEDTFGLHKGQPPRLKRRLLLQVEYSVNPIAVYTYQPSRDITAQIDPYINRLYVDVSNGRQA